MATTYLRAFFPEGVGKSAHVRVCARAHTCVFKRVEKTKRKEKKRMHQLAKCRLYNTRNSSL